MTSDQQAYGLWGLALVNTAVFVIFAYSFTRPRSPRDWRAFGAFSAFLVALFVEMYGVPLTIYLLSGWLGRHYPQLDPLSHDAGHLWNTLLGWKGDPHLNPLHILSNLIIAGGFLLLAVAWRVLYKAQTERRLATAGPYAYVRHPQYVAFIAIMFGFLLEWPTLLTLVMFPILVVMYVRLARKEEQEMRTLFPTAYAQYAASTPAFIPRIGRGGRAGPSAALGAQAGKVRG